MAHVKSAVVYGNHVCFSGSSIGVPQRVRSPIERASNLVQKSTALQKSASLQRPSALQRPTAMHFKRSDARDVGFLGSVRNSVRLAPEFRAAFGSRPPRDRSSGLKCHAQASK
jgi:hypothetical protein